jgi:hypothetical protein
LYSSPNCICVIHDHDENKGQREHSVAKPEGRDGDRYTTAYTSMYNGLQKGLVKKLTGLKW